jgi:sugar-specific transcriptional regulator TrmB
MKSKKEQVVDMKRFGLSNNQAVVYQVWLQLWSFTVTKVSRESGISRVLAYNTLQELIKKGYASCVMKWNTGWYVMARPEVISQSLHHDAGEFDMLLPEFNALINKVEWGFNVLHFQWANGIKSLYYEISQSETDLMAYVGVEHIEENIKKFLYNEYLPVRLARWIHSRSICAASERNQVFGDTEVVPQTEIRYITDPGYHMDCEIVLFDHNKIAIASMAPEEMSWILITSKRLHDSFAKLFEWSWRILANS